MIHLDIWDRMRRAIRIPIILIPEVVSQDEMALIGSDISVFTMGVREKRKGSLQ